MDTDPKNLKHLIPKFIGPQQPTNMPTPPEASEQSQHPKVAPLKYTCDICFKKFRSGQALGGHKSMHLRQKEAITSATPSIKDPIFCLVCCKNFRSKDELFGHLRSHAGNMFTQADYNSSNSSSTVSDETMFDDGVDSGSSFDLAMKLPAGWSRTGKRKKAGSSDCSGSDETAVNSGLDSSPNLELTIVDRKFKVKEFSDLAMLADVCAEEAGGRILVVDDEIGIKYVKVGNCKRRKLNDAADQLDDNCNKDTEVFRCKLCDKTFSSYQALGGHTTSHNRPKINSSDHEHDRLNSEYNNEQHPHPHPHPVVNAYSCSDCNKTFSSHQALGGHVSSHKKNKNNNNMDQDQSNSPDMPAGRAEDNMVEPQKLYPTVSRQCDVCGKIFPTGQALGGHKRKHYSGPPEAPAKSSQPSNAHRHFEIDLNETPFMEDEDGIDEPSLLLKLN